MQLGLNRSKAVIVALCLAFLMGCSKSAEDKQLVAWFNDALEERGMEYWEAHSVTLNEEILDEEASDVVTVTHLHVVANLRLSENLQELRYVDSDRKIVVTHAGIESGKQLEVPAVLRLTRLREEQVATVNFDAGLVPSGVTQRGFRNQYKGWDVVEVGTRKHKALLDELDEELQEMLQALSEADNALARAQVQRQAAQAELNVLKQNNERLGGLDDAVQRSQDRADELDLKVAELQDQRNKQQDDVDTLAADIEKLQG